LEPELAEKEGTIGRDWPRVRAASRKVFIAHASEDTDIAFNVASLLKRYLDVDPHVEQGFLRAGIDWTSQVERTVRDSEVVIVLQSRVVAAESAEGVLAEVKLARALNIPLILGCIRGFRPSGHEQYVDFGEDGRRVEGVWGLAKYLLSESHQFRSLGLDSIHIDAAEAATVLGTPEQMANRAAEIVVFGHTMKQWLGDYGNAIRHGNAFVSMYFPAASAVGIELLVASHRNGAQVLQQIARAKQDALTLEKELADPSRFRCFTVPVKPMFSATAVDPARPDAFMVVDHYSFRVGAPGRPKLIVQGTSTPLFQYYWSTLQALIADAEPLTAERAK
jgi:hypothetical protein